MKPLCSDVSYKIFTISENISIKTIRHSILNLIQKNHPDFSHTSYLFQDELNYFRDKSVSDYLAKEIGELTDLEKTILNSMIKNETLADK
jgi:hypothetical protein